MIQELDDVTVYDRTVDELQLALMVAPCDSSDKICALVEVLCRMMAEEELIPDARFFSRVQAWMPSRVATLILGNAESGESDG
jgi:hypothetical protein